MGVFGTTEGINHVHGFAQSAHDYVLYNAQHRSRPFLLGYCSTVHKLDHAVSSQGRHYQGRHEFLDPHQCSEALTVQIWIAFPDGWMTCILGLGTIQRRPKG